MRRSWLASVVALLVLAALVISGGRADAHGVDPIGVAVTEHESGDVQVRLDRPLSLANAGLTVTIDAGCVAGARERKQTAARAVDELRFRCGRSLSGRTVHVEGLDALGLDAVFRAELADGTVHRSVVTASSPEISLPTAMSRVTTLVAYLALGAKHLLAGFDHLLFILGTLLLERRARRAALALTGFTIGHSLTLGAAVLGFLRVPAAWAEVGIALSLVWLAVLVARSESAPQGRPMVAASIAIGLVHGLGFADVLLGAGIPARELPLALFGFNLGIELAQLAVAACALVIAALALRMRLPRLAAGRVLLAHGIGALAVMWCIERVLAV